MDDVRHFAAALGAIPHQGPYDGVSVNLVAGHHTAEKVAGLRRHALKFGSKILVHMPTLHAGCTDVAGGNPFADPRDRADSSETGVQHAADSPDIRCMTGHLQQTFREWVRKGMPDPVPSFAELRDSTMYLPRDVIDVLAEKRGLTEVRTYGQAVRQLGVERSLGAA
ncbi:MAG TPA: hypothetical protein VNG34_12240 [Actinomycetota bacterium]|nr:hypothetical protein [Actinomycetota bacterium]